MQVIIPCAGLGTRTEQLIDRDIGHIPKTLYLKHKGRPLLDWIIESLLFIEPTPDFIFVLPPNHRNGYMIMDHLRQYHPALKWKDVVQYTAKGFGHAVLQATEYVTGEPVLIHASDIVLDFENEFDTEASWMAVKHIKPPIASGVMRVGDDGDVKYIIEKAHTFWCGVCYIREAWDLFKALQENVDWDLRTEGEFQMTDGLMCLVNSGIKIEAKSVKVVYK